MEDDPVNAPPTAEPTDEAEEIFPDSLDTVKHVPAPEDDAGGGGGGATTDGPTTEGVTTDGGLTTDVPTTDGEMGEGGEGGEGEGGGGEGGGGEGEGGEGEGGEGEGEEGELPAPLPQDQKRLSQIYTEIILKIDSQNRILLQLKDKIKEKCRRFPRTACEEREICNLKICMEQENLKLQCLVKEAITIQARDPDRHWAPIPVETTLDEDCMPIRMNYNQMTNCFGPLKGAADTKPQQKSKVPDFRCSTTSTSEMSTTTESSCAQMLKGTKGKQKRRASQYSKELCRSYSMQEKLVADNADLEGDRYKLQEELLSRDRMVECLQQKICLLHTELTKLCRQAHGKDKRGNHQPCMDEIPKLQSRVRDQGNATKDLSNSLDKLQNCLDCLRLELDSMKKTKDRSDSYKPSPRYEKPRQTEQYDSPQGISCELQKMKQKYCELMEDYAAKDRELCDLKAKVNAFLDGKDVSENNNTGHEAEVRLLREKLKESREEQEEFKVIICEQSKQVEDYREKYMGSLQKIEELKCLLQKMEMDNKRIEDQINIEIRRIKDKFQEKLQEFAQLPKMLENEQIKLAECCKEKDDLESKLRIVCRELKALKGIEKPEEKDDSEKLRNLQIELDALKGKYDLLQECKNKLCEKYEQTKNELDCLRTESAKIICRLKERAANNQAALQKQMDRLEQELAQCRATACLSIADREEIIKDMQAQLNCLGMSFDSAQKQIKSLKDHISYLSSGKADSVVICCQNTTAN